MAEAAVIETDGRLDRTSLSRRAQEPSWFSFQNKDRDEDSRTLSNYLIYSFLPNKWWSKENI